MNKKNESRRPIIKLFIAMIMPIVLLHFLERKIENSNENLFLLNEQVDIYNMKISIIFISLGIAFLYIRKTKENRRGIFLVLVFLALGSFLYETKMEHKELEYELDMKDFIEVTVTEMYEGIEDDNNKYFIVGIEGGKYGVMKIENEYLRKVLASKLYGKNRNKDKIKYKARDINEIIGCKLKLRAKVKSLYSYKSSINKRNENKETKNKQLINLINKKVCVILEVKNIVNISNKSAYYKFKDYILEIKEKYLSGVNIYFSNRDIGIINSFIFGDKSAVSFENLDMIRKNQIAHLIAVSGMHIGILFFLLSKGFRYCTDSMFFKTIVIFPFILCYGVMTGMNNSVIRAIIMLFIYNLLRWKYRRIDLLSVLMATGIIQILMNYRVVFMLDFQYSYMALIFIACFINIENFFQQKTGLYIFWKWLIFSIGIQIFIMPITAYYFKYISFSGILTSIILTPITLMIINILMCDYLIFSLSYAIFKIEILLSGYLNKITEMFLNTFFQLNQLFFFKDKLTLHIEHISILSVSVFYGLIFLICRERTLLKLRNLM